MSVLFHVFRHDPEVVQVPAGDFLFREGELSNGKMYVLAVGKANIILGDQVLETAIPSTLVGEMGLIEPGSFRSASVQAVTDCDFVAINESRFQHLVTDMPHFAMEVMRILVYRLRQSDKRLEALASGVKEADEEE
ncbi:MAG: cyclic nucleotide-binding domain-containing protein [Rhodocyclaceae bacterium]|nr:cyclic nucleotide-binding domain-containing protein [Rhodocyclaceae bacterium]